MAERSDPRMGVPPVLTAAVMAMLLAPAWMVFAAEPAATVDLDLTVQVHKYQRGALMIAVFDSEAAYSAGAPPIKALKLDVTGPAVHVVVPGLAAGRYGIKMFHDLDGNEKLAMNPFGIPTEPVAFSNNAKVNMRAPSWAEAAFDLKPDAAVQSIDID
jgi:uncharacterized protein (DUF2141 family)